MGQQTLNSVLSIMINSRGLLSVSGLSSHHYTYCTKASLNLMYHVALPLFPMLLQNVEHHQQKTKLSHIQVLLLKSSHTQTLKSDMRNHHMPTAKDIDQPTPPIIKSHYHQFTLLPFGLIFRTFTWTSHIIEELGY